MHPATASSIAHQNNMADPKATSNNNMEDPKPTPKNNSGDIPTMTFKSAKDAIAFVEGLEEKDRYNARKNILQEALRSYEQNLELAKETFKYMRDSGEYKKHVTAEEFYESWGYIAEMAEEKENKKTT